MYKIIAWIAYKSQVTYAEAILLFVQNTELEKIKSVSIVQPKDPIRLRKNAHLVSRDFMFLMRKKKFA